MTERAAEIAELPPLAQYRAIEKLVERQAALETTLWLIAGHPWSGRDWCELCAVTGYVHEGDCPTRIARRALLGQPVEP